MFRADFRADFDRNQFGADLTLENVLGSAPRKTNSCNVLRCSSVSRCVQRINKCSGPCPPFCVSGTSVHFTSNILAGDTQEHHDVRVPYHRVANDVLSGRQLNRSHLNRRNERDTTHFVNPHAASSSHGNRAQRYDDPGKCLIFQETHKFFLGNAFRFNSSWSVRRRVPSEYVLHPIRV
jgi:hypothetical protein